MDKSPSREGLTEPDHTSMEGRTTVELVPDQDQQDVVGTEVAAEEKGSGEGGKSDDAVEYISGWQLVAAAGIVGLACFTMLLDTSIVVTVSNASFECVSGMR